MIPQQQEGLLELFTQSVMKTFRHYTKSEGAHILTIRMMKYMRSIGQKTGTSKILNNVIPNAVSTAFSDDNQNWNSGRRRLKGLRTRGMQEQERPRQKLFVRNDDTLLCCSTISQAIIRCVAYWWWDVDLDREQAVAKPSPQ